MPRLPKVHKLCSRTKIEQLFGEGQSFIQYPLRVVYRIRERNADDVCPQFFINVPKKRFKRAVHRVWLRRRIREAYRLHRELLPDVENLTVEMAFLYVANEKLPFAAIERRMIAILTRIAAQMQPDSQPTEPES